MSPEWRTFAETMAAPLRTHIPNLVTLLNLFFGLCALIFGFQGRPDMALWFLIASFLCDTADGLLARALKAQSPLGAQLDSLADVVSFGVVPGILVYIMAKPGFCNAGQLLCWEASPAFLIPLAAAYRLGKFNIDSRQTSYFLGLSTPANTVFILGLVLTGYYNRFEIGTWMAANSWIWIVVSLSAALLMISEIPLAGLKIKPGSIRGNTPLILLALIFVSLIFLIKELAFSAIILIYIGYSLFFRNQITDNQPTAQ